MNRLIIIGNGFDLAHGLKTSYCDFLEDYVRKAIKTFDGHFHFDDPLLQIKNVYGGMRYKTGLKDDTNVFDLLQRLENTEYTTVEYKSSLLYDSMHKANTIRWVDLENDYYEGLLKLVKRSTLDVRSIKVMNDQFQYLKQQFEIYLSNIHIDIKPENSIQELLHGRVTDLNGFELNQYPKTIYFLNFNYTSTLNRYSDYQPKSKKIHLTVYPPNSNTINHIHGELNSPNNPIIFGFGDEYDDDYVKFENLKTNEVFRHIKSFGYSQTTNYHDLIRFLDSDDFEVYIIGHSCGISDRTMFREIFEHKRCINIRPFYYLKSDGSDDFLEKTYDIARHFTNKGMMRKKIVSKPATKAFPQYRVENT